MTLETDRLTLEPWQSTDWAGLKLIATDAEVMRYISGGVPWSDERIRRFIDRQRKLYVERGFCRWKLLEKPAGNLAGLCGVGFWRDLPEPEIGWWLARRLWGRGLATEAARAALRDAFDRAGLERVISIAMVGNAASRRIMEKLGMRFDREFQNGGVPLVRYTIGREPGAPA